MPRLIVILFVILVYLQPGRANAQTASSPVCSTAVAFCFSVSYSYQRGTSGNAESGPDYGGFNVLKNPSWFYMQIQNSGSVTFTINTNPANDTRYILWGPFAYPFSNCGSGLTASKIITYNNSAGNTVTIPSALAGEYYILLLTNNSGNSSSISFTQTGGTGSSNCDILCNLTSITAASTGCQSGSKLGTYSVTGTIKTVSPPTTGTLLVSSSCGTSVTYSPPFDTLINYTLPDTAGHGDSCTITATYSANSYCTKSAKVSTPKCCDISATSTISVCESQTLSLSSSGTSGGSYYWSGPSSYSSTQQNPVISKILQSQGGTYQVYLVYGGCTTPSANVNVTVNPKPIEKSIIHE